jgi:hypothetical protein
MATVVAASSKKASLRNSNVDEEGRLKGIGFDAAASSSTDKSLVDIDSATPLEKSDATAVESSSDNSVSGYCRSCSGGTYGCIDCSSGTYYCCSGWNICCGGRGYCASSCSSYDDDYYDDDSCFHEDSIIHYKGTPRTLAEFLRGDEPECVVPHVVDSIGLDIATDCGTIGVTRSHLLSTSAGYLPADSFKVGDYILSEKDNHECKVTGITQHKETKKYFGLNCLESEVVVDGMRASTFGNYHALPASFMYYAGNMFGISTASMVGEKLGNMFFDSDKMFA